MKKEELLDDPASNITTHTMTLMSLVPLNLQVCTAEELSERCFNYLKSCIDHNLKPSVAGFAFAIGTSRMTLLSYIKGETACPLDNREILERYYNALNAMIEDYMQNNCINTISAIFLLKNNFGYKDQQEYIVNNNQEQDMPEDKLLEEANLLLETEPKKSNYETE